MLQSLDTLIAFVLIMTVASLFVTIVVQMCSAALSLRGKNLANALAITFQTIAPGLGPEAHQLAAKILRDPLLSDSTRTIKNREDDALAPLLPERPWHFTDIFGATQMASAVRPEEVYAALKRLAQGTGKATPSGDAVLAKQARAVAQAASRVLEALVIPEDEAASIRAQLAGFQDLVNQIPDPALRQKLLTAVEDTPAQLMIATDAARVKFETWFGSAQDRAQQWFQLHTRGLTIAASALIALVLQLDAVEIFRYASSSAAGRSAVLASAENVIAQAAGALDERGGLIKRVADAWARRTQRQPVDLAGITNMGQLQAALALQGNFDAREFDRVLAATTRAYYNDRRNQLADLTRAVSATGFEFIPQNYWRWPAEDGLSAELLVVSRHLPGIALCAALLTLGAPYWYNLLKNLTSLRPALAQLIGQEESARAENEK